MPTTTTNLALNKTDTTSDGGGSFVDKNEYFNFDTDLNDNWDKIDAATGKLSNLTTTEKGSLVGAINEITGSIPDVSGKVNKSGDTMTGQLAFDKSLNGYASFNINDIPLKTQMDCITNANNLPVANVYGNGCVCVDNNGDYCYREYDRWTTTGQYLKQWIVTCRDANNEAQNAILALSVNTAGKTTFGFPMCDTKPTTVSSASNNKVAVVTQNYVNDNSWYRIWSDGFIEQGGKLESMALEVSVSLLKSFSNTKYNIVITPEWSTTCFITVKSSDKAKGSFKVLGGGNPHNCYWRACGY